LPKCQFTTQYYNFKIGKNVDFDCQEEPLVSGFCIFHDKGYLQDKTNNEEQKKKVLNRLKYKLNQSRRTIEEPLLCIGFRLPDFILSDLKISKEFGEPVYFSYCDFFGKADFAGANFQGEADFYASSFYGKTYFSGQFSNKMKFNYVLFEGKEKVIFDIENL
jgi:hypothetical protein